jgi:4-amino-4-deoxy-L-arabinose transferase-like glycosyltransferase
MAAPVPAGQISYEGPPTPLKATLFLTVCLAWLLPGLVGHDPWKPDEAVVFGAVFEMLRTGDFIVFRLAGEPYLERAPLYMWVAGVSARLFGGFLPLHDAARLASGMFMAMTLGFLSLAARELLGDRAIRVAVLLFIGCMGLLIRAHEMSTDLAGLAGIALGLYGLALASRLPIRGGVITGLAMGLAFLGDGFLPLAMMLGLVAVLPMVHPAWRTKDYAISVTVAVACAAPLVAAWPLALWMRAPMWLTIWFDAAGTTRWASSSFQSAISDLGYFVRIMPWYAWPAWPLAAWSVWRARRMLATRKGIALPLVAFVVFLVIVSVFGDAREVNAMPLLLPLALLGVAELDSLPRGGASALDWFGMTTFFLIAAMLWVCWIAVMTGQPAGVLRWIESEVPGYYYPFRFLPVALASLLTLIWLVVIARSLRSPRRALVNWTAGITMVWMLVMTLGVPLVDQARSYRAVSAKIVEALPRGFHCIASSNLGDAQRASLDYFVNMQTIPVSLPAAARCRVLLAQTGSRRVPANVLNGWHEIWRGSRPGDRNESFVLYARDN